MSVQYDEINEITALLHNSGPDSASSWVIPESSDADVRYSTPPCRPRPGYLARVRSYNSGRFIHEDKGTFLASSYARVTLIDAFTTSYEGGRSVADLIEICKVTIINPYFTLLKVVGWQPLFDDTSTWWKRVVNVSYLITVILIVLAGIIGTFISCFRLLPIDPDNKVSPACGALLPAANITSWDALSPDIAALDPPSWYHLCGRNDFPQYVIPILASLMAYVYSFYLLYWTGTEQLPKLMTTVFLKWAEDQPANIWTGRLIRKLQLLLYGSAFEVLLFAVALTLLVIDRSNDAAFANFWHITQIPFGRRILLAVLWSGYVIMEVVSVAVVVYYCVQCFLIIYYIKAVWNKMLLPENKNFSLTQAMEWFIDIEEHIRELNKHPAIAVSLSLVNIGAIAVFGSVMVIANRYSSLVDCKLLYASLVMFVALRVGLLTLPIVAAAMVTSFSRSLRRLGPKIAARPFGYEENKVSEHQILLFLILSSNMRADAKLFLMPIRGRNVLVGLVLTAGILLLLTVTDVFDITITGICMLNLILLIIALVTKLCFVWI